MTEFVRLEVEDGVGTVRLDRPPMNALNLQFDKELLEIAAEATDREDVAAVVVYGGEKLFAAGADVKEMASLSYAQIAQRAEILSRGIGAMSGIPKPTVAAITGYALGGGFELALGCDRRVAGENATIGQPEILLGIIPGAGGTQRMTRLIGPAKTKDIVYTGRFVKADEALALGLVDQVVAPDEVYSTALAWAKQFVGGPARALAAAKTAIDRGLDMDLRNGLALESEVFAALFGTEDQSTGMASFIENGPGKASFQGR